MVKFVYIHNFDEDYKRLIIFADTVFRGSWPHIHCVPKNQTHDTF